MLGFLTPIWLLLATTIGFLFLIYRYREKGLSRKVSSLHIFKKLKNLKLKPKKFKPPLRFFLEALAILLMSLAAAQFYFNDSKLKAALLIDNSLNMKPLLADLSHTITTEIQKNSSVRMFTTSPELKEIFQVPTDTTLLSDSTSESLAKLANDFDQITVITNKELELPKEELFAKKNNLKIVPLKIGAPSQNLSFDSIKQRGDEIILTVKYYGKGQRNFEIVGSGKTLFRGIVVGGSTTEAIFFRLPDLTNVTIKTEGEDSIKEDSSIFLPTKANSELILIGGDKNLVKGLPIQALTIEELQNRDPNTISGLIAYKTDPENLPVKPLLMILPQDSKIISSKEFLNQPTFLSSWIETSPITKYLKLNLLKIPSSQVFQLPSWGRALLNCEKGPLLVNGEERGRRLVAIGFEIFPFEGEKSPISSVLTLNILNWLREGTLQELQAVGGRITGIKSGVSPSGKIVDNRVLVDEIGKYEVIKLNENSKSTIYANIIGSPESDTFNLKKEEVALITKEIDPDKRETKVAFLLWIGVVLLLFDLITAIILKRWAIR